MRFPLLAQMLMAGWLTLTGTGVGAANALDPLPTLVLASTDELMASRHGRWAERIYSEAARRLGYRLEVRPYPAARAAALTTAGVVDGAINRMPDYGRLHPELLRINPAHFSLSFYGYSLWSLELRGWDDLRAPGVRVECRRGIAKCEIEVQARVAPALYSSISTPLLGLRKVLEGRTDVYVDVDDAVAPLLMLPEFSGSPLHSVGKIKTVAMHAYLHRRHAALAERLSATLAQLKREGFIARSRQLNPPAAAPHG